MSAEFRAAGFTRTFLSPNSPALNLALESASFSINFAIEQGVGRGLYRRGLETLYLRNHLSCESAWGGGG